MGKAANNTSFTIVFALFGVDCKWLRLVRVTVALRAVRVKVSSTGQRDGDSSSGRGKERSVPIFCRFPAQCGHSIVYGVFPVLSFRGDLPLSRLPPTSPLKPPPDQHTAFAKSLKREDWCKGPNIKAPALKNREQAAQDESLTKTFVQFRGSRKRNKLTVLEREAGESAP